MSFTDEATVRGHLGGIDAVSASSSSIGQAIIEAHQDILRDLKSEYVNSEDAVLVQCETEMASSCLLRILANKWAVEEVEVQTQMLKVFGGKKIEDLLQMAVREENAARGRLQPFLDESQDVFGFELVEGSERSEQEA